MPARSRCSVFLVGVFFVMSWLPVSNSRSADLGVTAQAGTLGAAAGLKIGLGQHLTNRWLVNGFAIERDQSIDDIDYRVDLQLASLATFLDWHPFGNAWRVSLGGLINGNELELEARSGQTLGIAGNDYEGELRLTGETDFRPVAPYLGLGWGVGASQRRGWSLGFDLGVIFQGAPGIDLEARGTATRLSDGSIIDAETEAAFQEDLRQQEARLEDDLEPLRFYPVLSLGIAYHF